VQVRWEREEGAPALDPLRVWFRERTILAHDLFHVLTDYGTDEIGEATLLAFTLAQLGGRGQAVLTAGAALEAARALGWRWLLYDYRAWRRGRRAAWLVDLPWEELLPLRLETVRSLVRVEDSRDAHPQGVLRGNVDEAAKLRTGSAW
jgi:ubiquinone biosynthesis protein COQ4